MNAALLLKERLYAALRHSRGCSCGECSGGLNAVDDLVRMVDEAVSRALAAEAERDTLRKALRQIADATYPATYIGTKADGTHIYGTFGAASAFARAALGAGETT